MVDIFKKKFQQGSQEAKKWALISLENITKPKIARGIALREPYILNQVMGTKIYWRWI